MRKVLFLASLLLAAVAIAAPVTPEKAQQTAAEFLQQHRPGLTVQSSPVVGTPHMMSNGQLSLKQTNYFIFI